jgi:hypothetical protein
MEKMIAAMKAGLRLPILRVLAAVAALLGLLWSAPALAWGDSGHRTVCTIAFANLTPTARAEATRLLQVDPAILGPARQNADYGWACTYPDHPVAGGPGRRSPEHFVNYPRSLRNVAASTGCGAASICVLTGIASDFATLRSTTTTDRERHAALVYLGHWLGDIHQPLHASFADDRGGNEIEVSAPCRNSLHSTWDTCLLQLSQGWNSGPPSVAAVGALAEEWSRGATARQRRTWLRAMPWQWARESYAAGTAPWTQYCIRRQGRCRYSSTSETYSDGMAKRSVTIDDAYRGRAEPLIRQRITQAGIRLAHQLNLALDPAYRG